MRLNRGWKESFQAIGFAIFVGVSIAAILWLTGCTGTRVLAEYEHHSSAQDFYDLNTSDQVGVIVAVPLRFRETDCDRYCPELEAGLSWEVTGKPTFGRDPVGTIRLRQPIFVKE